MIRERRLARTVASALMLLCTPLLGEVVPPSPSPKIAAIDESWRWLSNEHFELLTNATERRGREMIEQLESFRATLATMMGGVADPPNPIRVVLFDRVWDFAPYQPLDARGKPESFAGYFMGRGATNYFAISGELAEYVPRIVLHEYSHLLISSLLGRQPTWINEGLAEYLSSFRYIAREKRAEIGRPIADHMQYLNGSTPLPLPTLLRMTYESPEFGREVSRSLFYAKSWLLVHYLKVGAPKRAGALARFAGQRGKGTDDVAAFEQAVGCTVAELDQELAIYQRKSLVSYESVPLAEDPAKSSIAVRPATTADAVYRLGEYLAALGPERRGEALAHFAAAGRAAPQEPVAAAPSAVRVPQAGAEAAHPPVSVVAGASPVATWEPVESPESIAADQALGVKYAEALDLVNAQKIEAGGEALAEVIRTDPDSRWAEMARNTLKTVDDFLERKRGKRPQRNLPPATESSPPSSPPS